jgi:hypothetical protein
VNKEEKLKAALAVGVAMRVAQKKYFSTRDRTDLGRSKTLEREFDKAAAEAMREDGLFDQPTGGT